MTNEQLERAVEFLLANQAKHDAQMAQIQAEAEKDRQAMKAAIDGMAGSINAMTEAIETNAAEVREDVAKILAAADRMERIVGMLAQTQVGMGQRMGRLEDRVDKLENS